MNNRDTRATDSVEVLMDAKHFSAQHLSHSDDPAAELKNPVSGHATENGMKTSALPKTVVAMAASHFPMMKEGAWGVLLSVMQPTFDAANVVMTETIFRLDYLAFILSHLALSTSEEDSVTLGVSRLGELSRAEILSAMLVSDSVWTAARDGDCDLRTILSQFSGRPMECVFSDDPEVEDLWEVTGVTFSDAFSGQVTFSYAGAPIAALSFELATDQKKITCHSLECEETRPLVLRDQDLRSWLFDLAFAKIFDALPD